MNEKMVNPIEPSWNDFKKGMFTPTEIVASEIRSGLVAARKSMGVSQKALSERSGVGYSTISKYENGRIDSSIGTLLKILNTLAKTLVIADIEDDSL